MPVAETSRMAPLRRGDCRYPRAVETFLLVLSLLVSNAISLNTPIITCASSSELERAASFFCRPGDNVLELGAQYADASLELCETIAPTGTAILVDVQRSDAKSGRCPPREIEAFQGMPGVHATDLPSLDDWKRVLFNGNSTFDVVVVDLAHLIGNDLHLSTLSLTNEVVSLAKPRVVLVKSKSLASLARRLLPAQHVLEGHHLLEHKERSSEPYILCSVGVEEYRRLIPTTVQQGDVVLEVGCHFGRTTKLLDQAAKENGYGIGVDIGPKIIKNAKSRSPSVEFAVADARRTLDLLKLRKDGILGYDVVYADIGGLSGSHGTLEALTLMESLATSLEPRCIVIKSLCMKRLASQLRSFTFIWAKNRDGVSDARD